MIQKCTFTYGGGDKNMVWFVGLVLGLGIHLFAEIQVVDHAQPLVA